MVPLGELMEPIRTGNGRYIAGEIELCEQRQATIGSQKRFLKLWEKEAIYT